MDYSKALSCGPFIEKIGFQKCRRQKYRNAYSKESHVFSSTVCDFFQYLIIEDVMEKHGDKKL